MTNPSPNPEVYEKAAEVIEQRGWIFDGYFVPEDRDVDIDTCPVCVLGALNVALGRKADSLFDPVVDGESYRAAAALAEHLGYDLSDESLEVSALLGDDWNDRQAGSVDVVTRTLREFAASLKAGA